VDQELESRGNDSRNQLKTTRVIVTFTPGATLPNEFKRYVSRFGNDRSTLLGNNNNDDGKLNLINGQVLELPNYVIKKLAANPSVFRLHYDRPVAGHNYRTAVTVGARTVQDFLNQASGEVNGHANGVSHHLPDMLNVKGPAAG